MSNVISSFIKKKLLGKKHNLVSLDDQYETMRRLLKGHKVTGILDAGASDGRVSKKLLRKFPEADVYAFEPNPGFKDVLQEYAKKESRLHPFFAAVSDFNGQADFHLTKARGYASLFAPAKRLNEIRPVGSPVNDITSVNVVTIDRWAAQNGNIPIQLIKFDIQGAEVKALQGASKVLQNSVLLVYTEIWFHHAYDGGAIFADVDDCLRRMNFELYDLFKPHYDPFGRFSWANVIYIHTQRLSLGG